MSKVSITSLVNNSEEKEYVELYQNFWNFLMNIYINFRLLYQGYILKYFSMMVETM